jgi:hypothetical protein
MLNHQQVRVVVVVAVVVNWSKFWVNVPFVDPKFVNPSLSVMLMHAYHKYPSNIINISHQILSASYLPPPYYCVDLLHFFTCIYMKVKDLEKLHRGEKKRKWVG